MAQEAREIASPVTFGTNQFFTDFRPLPPDESEPAPAELEAIEATGIDIPAEDDAQLVLFAADQISLEEAEATADSTPKVPPA